jgi:hypothetical protein
MKSDKSPQAMRFSKRDAAADNLVPWAHARSGVKPVTVVKIANANMRIRTSLGGRGHSFNASQ